MSLYAPAITLGAFGIFAVGLGSGYSFAPQSASANHAVTLGSTGQCHADREQLIKSQVDRERSIVVALAQMEARLAASEASR